MRATGQPDRWPYGGQGGTDSLMLSCAEQEICRQHIRMCRAGDGVRIAVASSGKGPPLVRAAHWLSHVEFDARSPVWAHWLRELSRDHCYIRHDQRGCGLSDWRPPSFGFENWVGDLEAVADTLGLKRFALFGMSQGGAVAIAYAARHPERVSHLVLLGAYAQGRLRRAATAAQREEAEILLKLIRFGWGRDNPAFRQLFTSLFIPGGSKEQQQWFNDLERISATPDNAAAIIETSYRIDVEALAETLRVPTLVCHARHDARVPFEEGRRLAALIPTARFLPLDSHNHVLLEDEPAWPQFLSELRAFLGVPELRSQMPSLRLAAAGLTPSEVEVARLIGEGLGNGAIAAALRKSEKTVRNQVSAVFSKLGVKTRAEAVVLARDAAGGA
jgi:pimeloyl-ACP methyl ester carboxylesterase/DNA-binding CsgD family transcriptional regulator